MNVSPRAVLIFPPNPTIGDTFDAPNGVTYIWDGVVWTVAGGGTPPLDDYVLRAGDTMTGALTVSAPADGAGEIRLTGSEATAPGQNVIRFRTAAPGNPAVTSWMIQACQPDFLLRRYVGGNYVDQPLSIDYGDGHVNLRAPRTETGDPINDDDLVRKAYADSGFVRKTGDIMTGGLVLDNAGIRINVINLDAWIRMEGGEAAAISMHSLTSTDVRWVFGSWFQPTAGSHQDSFAIAKLNADMTRDICFEIKHADTSIYGHKFLVDAGDPIEDDELARKAYVDAVANADTGVFVRKDGDIMTGSLTVPGVDVQPNTAGDGVVSMFGDIASAEWSSFNPTSWWARTTSRPILPMAAGDFAIGANRSGTTAFTALKLDAATGAAQLLDVEGARFTTSAGDPIDADELTRKAYVDAIVTSGVHYQGTWSVAPNQPNLIGRPNNAGDLFICITSNPAVPERASPDLPGIANQLLSNGDWIIWAGPPNNAWGHITGSGISRPEADEAYLQKDGDTMRGDLALAGLPTLPPHATNKEYVDGSVVQRALQLWRAGANYPADTAVYYDNRAFIVKVPITNAPVTPDFTTISPIGWGQADYWHGNAGGDLANWIAGNWVHIATLPVYGTYRVEISDLHPSNDTALMFDIVTGYNTATATLVGMTHQGTGTWSELRLSQTGNQMPVRLELRVATRSGTPNFKVFIHGETRLTSINQVAIEKPLAAIADGANLGGTTRAVIEHLRLANLATSGDIITANGKAIRLSHANPTNNDDGKIGARLFQRGLNIVGVGTETGDARRRTRFWGDVEIDNGSGGGDFETLADNRGLTFYGGARIYKKSGSPGGLTLRKSGIAQPGIEEQDGSNRRDILDTDNGVRKSGDTMTGGLTAPDFTCNRDNWGFGTFEGGWFYKKAGTGLTIRCHAGNIQPGIEDWNGANRRDIIDTQNGDARYALKGAAAGGPPDAFCADMNGVDIMAPLDYSKWTWQRGRFNINSKYQTLQSRWVPRAGVVQLAASVGFRNLPLNTNCWISIRKNTSIFVAEISAVGSGSPSNNAWNLTCHDIANGTDYYEVFIHMSTNPQSRYIKGDIWSTFFSGAWLGPSL